MPLYVYGSYASENSEGNLRWHNTAKKIQENLSRDPNPFIAEAESLASSDRDLMKRYRTKLTREEVRSITGEDEAFQNRDTEIVQSYQNIQKPDPMDREAPTSYLETPSEYKKRTTIIPWHPGKHVYSLTSKEESKSKYHEAVQELGLPVLSGISGTLDQSMTMANLVGKNSFDEGMTTRLAYIAWMVPANDHSLHEIMLSSKSFGLPYTPGPDACKDIYPQDPHFQEKVREEQIKRGQEMPDYYLSQNYILKKAKDLNLPTN